MQTQQKQPMGEVHVTVRLSNAGDVERMRIGLIASDEVRMCEVDAVVDTGTTRSIISHDVADRLGLNILAYTAGQLADGSRINVGVCSPIAFEILGRETFEDAYVLGNDVLIGQTVLESTDLLVDCRNQKVIPNPAHPDGPLFRL